MSSSQPNAAPTAAPSASSVNPPALADRGEALTPLQEEALLSAAPQLNSSGSFEKGKGKEAEMKDAAEPFPPPPEHNLDKALKHLLFSLYIPIWTKLLKTEDILNLKRATKHGMLKNVRIG